MRHTIRIPTAFPTTGRGLTRSLLGLPATPNLFRLGAPKRGKAVAKPDRKPGQGMGRYNP